MVPPQTHAADTRARIAPEHQGSMGEEKPVMKPIVVGRLHGADQHGEDLEQVIPREGVDLLSKVKVHLAIQRDWRVTTLS